VVVDASEPEGDQLKGAMTYLGPEKSVRNGIRCTKRPLFTRDSEPATDKKPSRILSRSAFTGQQRNGSISGRRVSANWETLRRQIPAGSSFGMSGFPYWTTDLVVLPSPGPVHIDGVPRTAHPMVPIRRVWPDLRIHGYKSENGVVEVRPRNGEDPDAYDQLRYRLLPLHLLRRLGCYQPWRNSYESSAICLSE